MIFVFAGNYREAQACSRQHELGDLQWTYLHSLEQLRGTENPNVIRYGTYRHRKDFNAIEDMIKSRWRPGPSLQ